MEVPSDALYWYELQLEESEIDAEPSRERMEDED